MFGTDMLALCWFIAHHSINGIRALRRSACPSSFRLRGHAVLAHQELPRDLVLSVDDNWHLGFLLLPPPFQPELDQSLETFVAGWRRSGSSVNG